MDGRHAGGARCRPPCDVRRPRCPCDRLHDRRLQRESAPRVARLRADRGQSEALRRLSATSRRCTAPFTPAQGSPRCSAPRCCRSSASSAEWTTTPGTPSSGSRCAPSRRACSGSPSTGTRSGSGGTKRTTARGRPSRHRRGAPSAPERRTGPIVAGNVNTLLLLHGTPWWPSLEGALLLLEDDDEYGKPWMVERQLFQLRQLGAFHERGRARVRPHRIPQSGFENETMDRRDPAARDRGHRPTGRRRPRLLAHRARCSRCRGACARGSPPATT